MLATDAPPEIAPIRAVAVGAGGIVRLHAGVLADSGPRTTPPMAP